MRRPVLALVLFGFICGLSSFVTARVVTPSENTAEVVSYLLDYVLHSDCVFIRNGSEHTAAEATNHLKSKYDYFKKDIKAPEDFIRLAATKSSMSGELYKVKLKDGREITSADWLTGILADYRKARAAP
ncbi:MAG TPA: DUF5329 domain-containing protein [Opitutaceae bacterium]|nr:DUF5329 domain-containing protein [Opitutaceae bacterium]